MLASMDHLDGIAAAWRRERPDVEVGALEVLGRLLRTAQLADRKLSKGLSGAELQPGWFDLLAALRRRGEPFELNPTQLMQATMLSSGGMTKRLDRLADAGLVERVPDPADRRGTLVRLTPLGRKRIDDALPVHVSNEDEILSALSPHQRDTLNVLLRKLLSSLETG
jgi:DNA-binding MarR family transcriptional regulator